MMQAHDDTKLSPATIVIFGVTGDLAQRKLLPALYHLVKNGVLHDDTAIVGITRRAMSVEALLNETTLCSREPNGVCDGAALQRMRRMLRLHQMDLLDGNAYDALRELLDKFETRAGAPLTRLFYLSIPPNAFGPIVALLGARGLNGRGVPDGLAPRGEARLLVEKPFGYDLASAQELITQTNRHFHESQIFRIDHYLAKETVQNILTFRFQNPLFEPLWHARHVSRIVVEATERIGIEGRAVFYEQTGALRDFVQSHLLQLLAAVTMERPQDMSSDAIHAARLQLLASIEPIPTGDLASRTIRGQYRGYRNEVGDAKTYTETFAALRLAIANERWRGVPVIMRTGKALDAKRTAVSVFFGDGDGGRQPANVLTFAIQPHEGIGLDLHVKRPGFTHRTQTAAMDFRYDRTFEGHVQPDAYERVLADAVRGDRTLFAAGGEVLASWRVLQPVAEAWSANGNGLRVYEPGSPGPDIAALLQS